MAEQPRLTCIVTIHGVGFQQPPDDMKGVRGYADDLHDALKDVLPDLGDDPDRPAGGPVYVQSDPADRHDRHWGLKRLEPASRLVTDRATPARIGHVALVYCNSEDWRTLHVGSAVDCFVRGLTACGRYLSIVTSPVWLLRVVSGLRRGPPEPTPSLRRRGDMKRTPSAGSSRLHSVLWGVINDACAYVCENEMRSRIRGFVWQALSKLAAREDVEAIVVNAHSQGTAIALDALAGLEQATGEKVKLLITAGSHLRKFVDLFAWGCRIYQDDPSLPWLSHWFNFWDDADPVADPLRPGPKWKAGARAEVAPSDPTLYRWLDPNSPKAMDIVIHDRPVENTRYSRPGGLRAHNYWDNKKEFVASIPELFREAGIDGPAPPGGNRRVEINSSQGG